MSTVWAASVRHLLRHPAQLALALAGLALGVATITAVDIAAASASRAFELSLSAVDGPATDEIVGGPSGIDEQVYVRLATRNPRLLLAPVVEGYVTVGREALQLVGIDPLAEASFRDRSASGSTSAPGVSIADGLGELRRWLTERGAVAMDASTAARLGIAVNGRFNLDIDGRAHPAVLIARGADEAGTATLLLTDIAQAQEWLGLAGRISRIELR
ncbi:MAG: ABC transporter permease, partial [Steroidobacteraceae bacterium]